MSKKILVLFFIFYGLFKLVTWGISQKHTQYMKIYDVGQGDAVYLKLKEVNVLIDGGPDYIADYLLSQEFIFPFCNLDYLVLTHPHADHLVGLLRTMQRCNIRNVIFNDINYHSALFDTFKELIGAKTRVITAKAGDHILTESGVDIFTLWPSSNQLAGSLLSRQVTNANDYSIVLLVDLGTFEILLTGDAEKENFARINSKLLSSIDGRLEVLKVSHHGSRDALNTSFLTGLNPELCIISSGVGNKYKHPNKEVLEFFESIKCKVQNTAQEGTIEVSMDKM